MSDKILKTKQYKKKGSPNILVIGPNTWMNDPKEYPDWFVDITSYSKKSKKPKESSTIIKKDLENTISSLTTTDFIESISLFISSCSDVKYKKRFESIFINEE